MLRPSFVAPLDGGLALMTSSAPGELLAELATHASQAETPQGTTTGHVSAKKMSGGTFFKRREALEKGVADVPDEDGPAVL